MICPNCNKTLPSSAKKICPFCKTKLSREDIKSKTDSISSETQAKMNAMLGLSPAAVSPQKTTTASEKALFEAVKKEKEPVKADDADDTANKEPAIDVKAEPSSVETTPAPKQEDDSFKNPQPAPPPSDQKVDDLTQELERLLQVQIEMPEDEPEKPKEEPEKPEDEAVERPKRRKKERKRKDKKQPETAQKGTNENGLTMTEAAYIAANRDGYYDAVTPIVEDVLPPSALVATIKILIIMALVVVSILLVLYYI